MGHAQLLFYLLTYWFQNQHMKTTTTTTTTFILSATFRFIEASLYYSEVSLLISILLIKKMRLREVNNFVKVHIVSKSHKSCLKPGHLWIQSWVSFTYACLCIWFKNCLSVCFCSKPLVCEGQGLSNHSHLLGLPQCLIQRTTLNIHRKSDDKLLAFSPLLTKHWGTFCFREHFLRLFPGISLSGMLFSSEKWENKWNKN